MIKLSFLFPHAGCLDYGIEFNGFNLEDDLVLSTLTWKKCQSFCQENYSCQFWTFLQNEGKCFLKNENAFQGREENIAAISGSQVCSCENYFHKLKKNVFNVQAL